MEHLLWVRWGKWTSSSSAREAGRVLRRREDILDRARDAQPEPAGRRWLVTLPPGAPCIRGHDVEPLQPGHPPLLPKALRQARFGRAVPRQRGQRREAVVVAD